MNIPACHRSDSKVGHMIWLRTALLPRPSVNWEDGQNLKTLHEYYTKVTDANRDIGIARVRYTVRV